MSYETARINLTWETLTQYKSSDIAAKVINVYGPYLSYSVLFASWL
jgi:hypothetical protein